MRILAGILTDVTVFTARTARRLPASPGSYVLLLHLPVPLRLRRGLLADATVPAGWHVYAGSANGPGGLRARLSRHLRRRKRRRWHVDAVSSVATVRLGIPLPAPAPSECELIDTLIATGGFASSLPRFGSSDCRRCPAHMLLWLGDDRRQTVSPALTPSG